MGILIIDADSMDYFLHLSKDKKFKQVLKGQSALNLVFCKDIPAYLCSSIISQQLSTKVAEVIKSRFLNLIDKRKSLSAQIMEMDIDCMRAVGLSNQKATYMKNLAAFHMANKVAFSKLHEKSDDEIIDFLTQVKGIGRWTVEMLLMFGMQREDVFPADDLGIQQAMIRLYGLESANKKILKLQMHEIAAKWSPYRTYASMHLWKWNDVKKGK